MLNFIRKIFNIRSKEQKYIDGYNAVVEAVENKDYNLMRDYYWYAINNDIDFDEVDKGIIKAYKDFHNNGTLKAIILSDLQQGEHNV